MAAKCVNIEENRENCPCSAVDCERYGVCCECISAHLVRNSLPSCVKTKLQNSLQFCDHVLGVINQVTASD